MKSPLDWLPPCLVAAPFKVWAPLPREGAEALSFLGRVWICVHCSLGFGLETVHWFDVHRVGLDLHTHGRENCGRKPSECQEDALGTKYRRSCPKVAVTRKTIDNPQIMYS